MIKRILLYMVSVCCLPICVLAATPTPTPTPTIQAFGLSTSPFITNNLNVDVCYLDLYDKQLQTINRLSKHATMPNAMHLMLSHTGEFKTFMHASACRYQAKALGLKKLPAVVINNKFTVLGQLNIAKVIQEYHEYYDYRETHHA